MYVYDQYDQKILDERVAQYRGQTERYLAGDLSEEEFLPLRLQNGLYVQRLAPMLRVAVPYGLMNSTQLRTVARLSRDFDKGYVHISTRQNIQFNWPELAEVPDMLAELAKVQMHAIQTSGNCIRNTTTDQFAGVARDELVDPRPYCEIIRQWSTLHPEFAFLPRKFKIAVCGTEEDRAAVRAHDIGIELVKNAAGEVGYKVLVGGGLGRTPVIGVEICDYLEKQHLLSYLEAILRVYNQHGRRDNKYKARIKILVKAMGIDAFREAVEAEWAHLKDGPTTLTDAEIERASSFFTEPEYAQIDAAAAEAALAEQGASDPIFANWVKRNTVAHRVDGYRIVNISLKATGYAPGDITDQQLELVADLADRFSFGELRSTHQQNLVLADVPMADLYELWQTLQKSGLATANIGYLTDMICCPGGDYCALANAKSIPVAESIQARFDDMDYVYDLGPLELNISGCMNACGHHHIGHIGILGVDKKGEEFYQVCLGGSQSKDASIGKILGPSFKQEDMADVMEKILGTYVDLRTEEENFLDTYRRVGIAPFKEKVYA
ncbi:sulfite reductase [Halioglobus japonicus]|uniref:Nitrite/sulfite reductase n=1 Tax=Halioglobus japonicus TaxID=930805 RepID=A0AAP8MIB7_9GAMM|nr:nitrite/sulfite reductase [Halioglobus japonicus]AQA18916.1 sulfite reductase [Halioglobus japonicus]PLW88072.1 nitrite/sulfite reductase [Halioglobus japonicus]GHD20688.1 sulfite reductase [Halioglobus japonicus]